MPETATGSVDSRALLEENVKLTREMHKMVRSMRRSMLWQRFFSFLWFLLVVGPLVASFFFLQPLIKQYGPSLQALFKQGSAVLPLLQGGGGGGGNGGPSTVKFSPDMLKDMELPDNIKAMLPAIQNQMQAKSGAK